MTTDYASFRALWPTNVEEERVAKWYKFVTEKYSEPGRHYHTLDHIKYMLENLDEWFPHVKDDSLRIAIWFHDVIYDATKNNNEDQSANAAQTAALSLGYDKTFATVVSILIRHTIAHQVQLTWPDNGAEILCDLDLQGLALPREAYIANSVKIRKEYGHATNQQWWEGRKKFLTTFLDRDTIFSTTKFREQFEQAARENMQAELTYIEGKLNENLCT